MWTAARALARRQQAGSSHEVTVRSFVRLRAAAFLFMVGCASAAILPPTTGDQTVPRPEVRAHAPIPRRYLAAKRSGPITIDGRLDDAAWAAAPWTDAFVDIEGSIRPRPQYRTRVKMLWDDTYWYIGAEIEEPNLWATITEHDAVIFRDDDFELFVDPSGSTHRYFEVEMNELATVWDLFLPKPYRDGGHAENAWDIVGLKIAVALAGTLNDPRDRDRGWSVELAIPWASFADSGHNRVPPLPGDQWRVNFSRVEWDVDTAKSVYVKRTDSAGHTLPEHNWVWSPQGAINMHLPELWGIVQFGGSALTSDPAADNARWRLRRVYYAERLYHAAHGAYATSLEALQLTGLPAALNLVATPTGWSASLPATEGHTAVTWHIQADGLIWHD
jgi:hypothetical protein